MNEMIARNGEIRLETCGYTPDFVLVKGRALLGLACEVVEQSGTFWHVLTGRADQLNQARFDNAADAVRHLWCVVATNRKESDHV